MKTYRFFLGAALVAFAAIATVGLSSSASAQARPMTFYTESFGPDACPVDADPNTGSTELHIIARNPGTTYTVTNLDTAATYATNVGTPSTLANQLYSDLNVPAMRMRVDTSDIAYVLVWNDCGELFGGGLVHPADDGVSRVGTRFVTYWVHNGNPYNFIARVAGSPRVEIRQTDGTVLATSSVLTSGAPIWIPPPDSGDPDNITLLRKVLIIEAVGGTITIGSNSGNAYSTLAPVDADICLPHVGRTFFGTNVTWGTTGTAIFNDSAAAATVTVTGLTPGTTATATIAAPANATTYSTGLAQGVYAFSSTVPVTLWFGNTEGGSTIDDLGDDFSQQIPYFDTASQLYRMRTRSQRFQTRIFAPAGSSVSVNGTPSLVPAVQYLTVPTLAPGGGPCTVHPVPCGASCPSQCNSGTGLDLVLTSETPFVVQTYGGTSQNDFGKYLVPIPAASRDADGDTISDEDEGRHCASATDTDIDGIPDYLDTDTDNDALLDIDEAGDALLSTLPVDTNGNGIGDWREPACLMTTTTTCLIGGICFPGGTVNTANTCEICDATMTRTGWSPRPIGTLCNDGLFCSVDDMCTAPRVCSGTARVCNDSRECTDMEVCDEVNDRCNFRLAVGCLIGGACIASGTRNPMNRCEVCDPTISGQVFNWTPLGGACDGDMDTYCPGGRDLNMDGDCSDAGEPGMPGDCLDTNAAVNPGAMEVCGNGLDDDCDGLTDNADPTCSDTATQDMDDDGFCPAGTDMNDDEDCLDAGEMTGPQDCVDTNAMINPSVVEEPPLCGDGADNDCDGAVDLADSGCSGDFDDDDGDGFCERGIDGNGDGDCRDPGEDIVPFDCNDGNMAVNPAAEEDCDNGIDDDCDTLVDTDDRVECPVAPEDLDDDGDGFCESGTDGNGDGDCLDAGEPGTPGDCDDTDPLVNPGATEDCSNGIDDDCDGATDMEDEDCASDERTDMDGDGFCPMGRDRNDDGDCLDEGEGTADADCDDTMAAVNPDAAEDCDNDIDDDCDGDIDAADDDCLDENLIDMDGDGFCPNGVDMNADGDCLDEGESGGDGDCDDTVAGINPGADEICDDTVDNDCDGDTDTEDADCAAGSVDVDGDGFCAGGGTDANGDGDCDDEGEGEGDADCDDSDDTINPGADEVCDDGEDNDCDGDTDGEDSDCPEADAGPDMGRPDSGTPDMGTVIPPGGPSGGAGCSATGSTGSLPSALFVLVALGLVLGSRRRRRD